MTLAEKRFVYSVRYTRLHRGNYNLSRRLPWTIWSARVETAGHSTGMPVSMQLNYYYYSDGAVLRTRANRFNTRSQTNEVFHLHVPSFSDSDDQSKTWYTPKVDTVTTALRVRFRSTFSFRISISSVHRCTLIPPFFFFFFSETKDFRRIFSSFVRFRRPGSRNNTTTLGSAPVKKLRDCFRTSANQRSTEC